MRLRLVLLCLMLGCVLVMPVMAHEGREVGEYLITFGWRNEPAYAGLLNGPEILISLHDAEDEPLPAEIAVELQAEVSFGDQALTLTLRPVRNEPGRYSADLIPALPGDYAFRVTGTIGDVDVDETFTSADGEFSSVEPLTDILFPVIETDERIVALEARIAALEALLAAQQEG
jgi:hypothetical protein